MDNSNIKVYLAISGALIVLLILVLIIPFTKKGPTQNNNSNSTNQQVFPTSIEINPSPSNNNQSPDANNVVPADFTGVAEEEVPEQIIDLAAQKKDLRQKVPLDFSTFAIDFDYSEDKFIVTLKDPKDTAQKEFESWKVANYPNLGADQFLLK